MANDVDWRQLREFQDIELTRSFVLAWQVDAGTLKIEVDLQLENSHPFYEEPRPAERVCIRPATIEFPYLTSLRAPNSDAADAAAVAQALPLGAIRGLRRVHDGPYEFDGEFGTVTIDAERPIIRFRTP